MSFHIYDDYANTHLPKELDGKFEVWDGEGDVHNYGIFRENVEAGEAFALMATSEDYRDNEKVIRFMDAALRKGEAVATGYYSATLLKIADRDAPQFTWTSGARSADIDLTWTGHHVDGDFDGEIEKVVCNNQIAIAPFQGAMTIFSGEGRFMALADIGADERIDTVEYVVDHIDTSADLQDFLGEDVCTRIREAISADNGLKA